MVRISNVLLMVRPIRFGQVHLQVVMVEFLNRRLRRLPYTVGLQVQNLR